MSTTSETSNASIVSKASPEGSKPPIRSTPKRSVVIGCRQYNKSHDGGVSCRRHISLRREPSIGRDVRHSIRLRKDSTSAETGTKRQGRQTNHSPDQSSRTTVSSADGTSLWADGKSDSQRNAAAQTLYRAWQRQHAAHTSNTLDGHMCKIFDSLDLESETRGRDAWNYVNVGHDRWETPSFPGVVDRDGLDRERRLRRASRKVRKKWHKLLETVFG